MKKLKENANNLILSLCEIAIGILLLVNPVQFTSGIIIVVGIVLTVCGIVSVIAYFRTKPEEAVREHRLSTGLIYMVVGIFCVCRWRWFIATFPMLTIIYGVMILFAGMEKIQWTVDSLRLKKKQWFLALISAALSIISAAIILMNPFTSTAILWTFAAVSLIIEAILDIVVIFFGNRIVSGKKKDEAAL